NDTPNNVIFARATTENSRYSMSQRKQNTSEKMRKFVQHDPPHPGEILADLYLEPLGLTVTEAAKKLLITRPNLSAIINGKAGISALMAIKLARAFKTTPHYWLNLQAAYDLWQAMAKHKDKDIDKVKSLV